MTTTDTAESPAMYGLDVYAGPPPPPIAHPVFMGMDDGSWRAYYEVGDRELCYTIELTARGAALVVTGPGSRRLPLRRQPTGSPEAAAAEARKVCRRRALAAERGDS